jgi:hypothetical protein
VQASRQFFTVGIFFFRQPVPHRLAILLRNKDGKGLSPYSPSTTTPYAHAQEQTRNKTAKVRYGFLICKHVVRKKKGTHK